MPEYKWALGNGDIVSADYNRERDSLSNDQVLEELRNAFQQFGHSISCTPVSEQYSEVYTIVFNDASLSNITICAKGTTPGGRSNLNDEQRTQQKSKYINYAFSRSQEGELAVQLGVYKRDEQIVFCAWKLKQSTANAETPISKQIKISTIARAMKEGFVQQDKGSGEYACAFRKEFIYFYINNMEWLHGDFVSQLAEHNSPISEETLHEANGDSPITFNTGYESKFSRNRILFGAPGTGKSFTLNGDRKEILYGDRKANETKLDLSQYGEYERVTFHPDYSYANFVGTYKPVPCKDESGKDGITYEYVPGPFMRTYVKALLNSKTETPKPYLLIIEEINRANVAAVFGDVFQLLDRDEKEVSEYPIQASEDMKKYLAKKLGGDPKDYEEIRIPDNMFIWATMNSADQGVFPMDTAFKRRWDFTYLGIDDSEDGIAGKTVVLGKGKQNSRIVEWNELRKAINEELLKYKVNEDKLMGPYFISKKNLPEGTDIDPKEFTRIFKNKVIMYLFDDAAKQKRVTLFEGCEEKSRNQYSKICNEFDEKGVLIFGSSISDKFTVIPEDDEQ